MKKKCCRCGVINNNFGLDTYAKDKLRSFCKKCDGIRLKKYRRTKMGLVASIHKSQRQHSKKRGHIPPDYTLNQLRNWIFKQSSFNTLFTNWENSGYKRWMVPSIDRLNNSIGYNFNNIRLVTWKENSRQACKDARNGLIQMGNKQKAVYQMDFNDKIIKTFVSIMEAERQTGINHSHISQVCNGQRNKTGGYKWKYV